MKKSQQNSNVHDLHDRGYKLLFSVYQNFQQLMEGFVDKSWTSRLDYLHSQKIDKSFIMKGFKKQETDILYKIPLLGEPDKEIFLYVLIEHQSSVDFAMPFRVLCYLVEIWRDFYKNSDPNETRQKEFRFPPVFLIVLYNGKEKWTASSSMREIVEHSELFGDFIPNICYHLIDIPRLDKEKLKEIGTALSGAFLIDGNIAVEEFEEIFKQGLSLIFENVSEEIGKLFHEWLITVFQGQTNEDALKRIIEEIASKSGNKKEIRNMLELMPQKLRDLGKQEEAREKIAQLLEIRIGPVSEATKKELQKITEKAKLEKLFVLSAKVEKMSDFTKKLRELK